MDRSIIERQSLLEAVKALPDEALVELSNFLDYLHYKAAHQRELTTHSSSFLLTVAGLGNSGQQDISERDEEILGNEIDPVYGWNLKPSNSV
ncbi:MAG: hypothetical protein RPG89_11670 [Microcystis panniformis WG22]|nr:hypothetical protein [Microcystis panniformis WG22]